MILSKEKIQKIKVAIYPLDGVDLSGEYKIADHVNLSGHAPPDIGFVAVTDLYIDKNNSDAIKVVCLKEGVVPDSEESKMLLKQGIKAYSYELAEPSLYAAGNEKQVDATGYVPKVPEGFKLAGYTLGLKESGSKDLGLIVAGKPSLWAGVFTQNKARAICVDHNIDLLGKKIKVMACNSGNANANTGALGKEADTQMREILASKLAASADQVLVASTGKVGVPLKIENELKAQSYNGLAADQVSIKGFAQAILTTDLVTKIYQTKNILGFSKGSGMIAPNMATMLGFVISDVKLKGYSSEEKMQAKFQEILSEVSADTFNCISVDGDTSTNDMLLFSSSCLGAELSEEEFKEELYEVCKNLATKIVMDGEGATKLIQLNLSGCADKSLGQLVGKKIINSSLVKTAIFGNDPNWGRINVALGNALVDVEAKFSSLVSGFDLNKVKLSMLGHKLFEGGLPTDYITSDKGRDELAAQMKRSRVIDIDLDLGLGNAEAKVWGSDLSYEYVRINAEYFT